MGRLFVTVTASPPYFGSKMIFTLKFSNDLNL